MQSPFLRPQLARKNHGDTVATVASKNKNSQPDPLSWALSPTLVYQVLDGAGICANIYLQNDPHGSRDTIQISTHEVIIWLIECVHNQLLSNSLLFAGHVIDIVYNLIIHNCLTTVIIGLTLYVS